MRSLLLGKLKTLRLHSARERKSSSTTESFMFEWDINDRHFHIREAASDADYAEVEAIQREAWGFADIDIVPGDTMRASQHAGGMLLCAFEGARMIGFAFGFPALENRQLSIHSHMLAVRSEVRNLQAGFYLKLAQREQAMAQGISEMTWTFDPLQSLNAHLNFTKLGVIARRYFINFYGETSSSPLHQGFGTDRLWVTWELSSGRVKQAVERIKNAAPSGPVPAVEADAVLLVCDDSQQPQATDELQEKLAGSQCFIEIPQDINGLKERQPLLGRAWREATRATFLAALEAGFTVSDFLKMETGGRRRGFYRLSR
jgi:predicted GNAT superfamily acetyltransferase